MPLWGLQTQIPAAASQCSQIHPPPFITPSAIVISDALACRAAQSEAVCVFQFTHPLGPGLCP